jgi:hypothetical protein
MRQMERSTASQPSVSDEPPGMVTAATDVAEHTSETPHIEHIKLPGLGSGPIFPFSWIFSRLSKLFKRLTSSH